MEQNKQSQSIIYRNAPAPKPNQDRVFQTIQEAVKSAIGEEITKKKDDFFLWQWIMWEGAEANVVNEMSKNTYDGDKVKAQDMAVGKYLSGELWNPVHDVTWLMNRFEQVIKQLNFPYIKKNIEKLKPGEVFGKFVMIRHGEKGSDGNLTPDGIQEAQKAGQRIKENNTDIMPSGYFGVQQPIVQMIMMALMTWEVPSVWWNGKSISQDIWEHYMPEEWKTPYHTWEETTFELALSAQFEKNKFESISKDEEDKYLSDNIILMIERNWYKKQFKLSCINGYFFEVNEIRI